MCTDAPDTSGVNQAARDNAQVAQDALDWFKGEAARTQGQRDQTVATQNAVANGQLDAMRTQTDLAKDYADYNKTTFRPLEQRIVSDSQEYDTPGRQQAAADQATADVRSATTRAMGAQSRNLGRMGYSMGGTNAVKMAQQAALAEAGAATGARRNVEATGRAMRMDAASLGRGLPSAQATAMQAGVAAGNGAVSAAGAANGSAASGADLMGRGFSTGIAGNQSAGNLYAQSADLSTRSNLGGWLNAAGGIGYAIGARSSKRVKRRGARMNDEEALEANNRRETDKPASIDGVANPTNGGASSPEAREAFDLAALASTNGKAIAALTERLERAERLLTATGG